MIIHLYDIDLSASFMEFCHLFHHLKRNIMKKRIMQWLLIAIVAACASSCKSDHFPAANTFVLVHGAWQAPYVWNSVKSQLEKAGQKVIVVELPAHGNDFTSPAAVSRGEQLL